MKQTHISLEHRGEEFVLVQDPDVHEAAVSQIKYVTDTAHCYNFWYWWSDKIFIGLLQSGVRVDYVYDFYVLEYVELLT